MNITILQLVPGAREATGLTVVIDVFRAFSYVCYAFDRGAKEIIPVGDLEHAYELKWKNPSFILSGERNEKKMPGFDFGNSPTHLLTADLSGKTIVHTTSAGTQGIVNAVNAGEIITGSFVNAGAVIRYISEKNPETVSLVCMGYSAQHPVEEDTWCAEYIMNGLGGRTTDFRSVVEKLREGSGRRFFIPETQSSAPATDFELCTSLDRFDFVVKAYKEGEEFILRKLNT